MDNLKNRLVRFVSSPIFPYFALASIVCGLYYKFLLLGRIPFPGDLLIVSYSPWFDYYKFPVQNPIISDVFSQFFLWKYLGIDSIKNLEWPLWNSYSFSGTPLLATYHSASLYPLNILLLFPKYFGWGVYIFTQSLLGSMSMYLFLSLYLKSRLAKLAGAIIFTFSGLMTTWLQLGTAGHALIWLPLSLYCITQYRRTFKLRYILLLTFSLSALILAGNAQITTYSFLIIPIFTLIEFRINNLKSSIYCLLTVFSSMLLAILLTSPQLLPSLDIFKKSIRLTESYTSEFNYGLLPLQDILKFFVADFFGNPVTGNYWGFLNYSETSSFVGSLTLPLILFAYLYLKKTKTIVFFLILLPASLILAFDNQISSIIYSIKIPLITSSYASRMLFISTFSISILSAFALDQIIRSSTEGKRILGLTILSWLSFMCIFATSLATHQIIQNMMKSDTGKAPLKLFLDFYLKNPDQLSSNLVISARNSFLPLLLASALLMLFIVVKSFRSKFTEKYSLTIICFGIFILITFDLGRYFLKFNPFVEQKFIFPEVPAISFLKNQPGFFRIGREHAETFPPNTWIAYNLQSVEGYDPIYLNQYGKFINFVNGGDIKHDGVSRYGELTNYKSTFLDAANTKYFIGIGRDQNGQLPGNLINYKFNEAKFKRVFQDKSAVVLENPNAMDRVYFAKSFKLVADAQVNDNIISQKFDPRSMTIITKNLNINSVTGNGVAKIINYTPNIVRIQTQTQSEEILVLADQYEEGWHAKIDGNEVLISPANLIFRAVKIPPGNHEIIFNYYPKAFDTGLKISGITLGLLSFLSYFAIRKKVF